MHRYRKILGALCAGLMVVSLAACKKEGGIEKAGKKIDKTIRKAGEKFRD